MATFLFLIYGDREVWADLDAAEARRIEAGHRRFTAEAGSAVRIGHELVHADHAASVRSAQARRRVTDGPFLETKEVIGGFYLVDADDLADATRLAQLLPETAADYPAGVEIRQVLESS